MSGDNSYGVNKWEDIILDRVKQAIGDDVCCSDDPTELMRRFDHALEDIELAPAGDPAFFVRYYLGEVRWQNCVLSGRKEFRDNLVTRFLASLRSCAKD